MIVKHTPRSWHRNIKPASKYTTVWAGRNTHVAYVATQGLTEEEIEGNINLIASAPDLLEALKSIQWRASKGACSPALIDMILQDCEAAIARAEGRDSSKEVEL